MLKKTTLVLSILLLCLSLVACGAPSGVSTIPEDKVPIALPEDLVPSGVSPTKDNVSSSYFLSEIPLEELETFYGVQFAALGVEGIVSYDAAKLVELELLPESTDGNTVLWASYGNYTIQTVASEVSDAESSQSSEVATSETPETSEAAETTITQIVPICVTIAQDGKDTAVMVAVGAQATRMALAHKLMTKSA